MEHFTTKQYIKCGHFWKNIRYQKPRRKRPMHLHKNLEEKDGQTRVQRLVSAYVVACLAVITLIKDSGASLGFQPNQGKNTKF